LKKTIGEFMQNSIMDLIKQSANDPKVLKSLESIFKLYNQLQYATNINQVAIDIFDWLEREFDIKNVSFSLFDINKNNKTDVLLKGEKFFLDDDTSFFFIINTHTNMNATVSFCASSIEHSNFLEENYNTIDSAFSIISTIVQNSILKKNFIESASLGSITNISTRQDITTNLFSYLELFNKEQSEIYILMIGIDEFDYEITDSILIQLAQVIHSNLNEFDLLIRLECNTFLVSILSNEDVHQACKVAKKIISDFSQIEVITDKKNTQTLKKSVSIGFEKFEVNSTKTFNEAIKNADMALQEARNKGKGQFVKFSQISNTN